MTAATLPLPGEPRALKSMARALLEQAPDEGLPLVVAGAWIADPLWERWRDRLEPQGMGRDQFDRVVADYGNELRLWVVGERPWDQVASGLAGRITRRLAPSTPLERAASAAWQDALGRVGLRPRAKLTTLVATIDELRLLYDFDAPHGRDAKPRPRGAASAIVWAGARPRDPEAPFGEGQSPTSPAAALAEALGRFLLKDPAFPPQ
jgi:hypothetical protein